MIITNLRLERLKKKQKQTEVAGLLGVSQSYYSMVESLQLVPGEDFKNRIEDYYQKNIENLLKEV